MSNDMVNHPAHYETNGIECIDAMIASQGAEAVRNYCVCNAFKYIWRHQHKGKNDEDIQKAIWYLNRYLNLYEGKDEPETDDQKSKPADLDYIIESLRQGECLPEISRGVWLNDHEGAIEYLIGNNTYQPLYIIDFDKIDERSVIEAFVCRKTGETDGITLVSQK